MNADQADFQTESFSNSRGWTTVRVTHTPSAIWAERSRGAELQSAVRAQKECIEEIERILAQDRPVGPSMDGPVEVHEREVTRAEFDALLARVTALERGIDRPEV